MLENPERLYQNSVYQVMVVNGGWGNQLHSLFLSYILTPKFKILNPKILNPKSQDEI